MALLKLWRQGKMTEEQFFKQAILSQKKSEKRIRKYLQKLLKIMKQEGI